MLILFLLIVICAFLIPSIDKSKRSSYGPMVSRSTPKTYPSDLIECGNCRGTGLDGFGIMPDSFECSACIGKGYHKIDPNAKVYTFSEFMEKYKIKNK